MVEYPRYAGHLGLILSQRKKKITAAGANAQSWVGENGVVLLKLACNQNQKNDVHIKSLYL